MMHGDGIGQKHGANTFRLGPVDSVAFQKFVDGIIRNKSLETSINRRRRQLKSWINQAPTMKAVVKSI